MKKCKSCGKADVLDVFDNGKCSTCQAEASESAPQRRVSNNALLVTVIVCLLVVSLGMVLGRGAQEKEQAFWPWLAYGPLMMTFAIVVFKRIK